MATTVLTLIQDFCQKMGLPLPGALVGATQKSTAQYMSLVRETVIELGQHHWEAQTIQAQFLAKAVTDQGGLGTLFSGYQELVQGSMWNLTRKMRIYGPLPEAIYNALLVVPNAGPEFQYWISRGHLYITPAPKLNEVIIATYLTKNNVLAADGITYKERVTADSDTLLFPDIMFNLCFEYKWRQQKGEAGWENYYNDYMTALARNVGKSTMSTLNLDSRPGFGPRPGIIVPPGSWLGL